MRKNYCNKHFNLIFIVSLVFFLMPDESASAQFGLRTGMNITKVRENYVENEGPVVGFHFGPTVSSHPFSHAPKLMIENELVLSFKGYHQHLDRVYSMRFGYLCGSFLLKYPVSRFVSLKSGLELDYMVYSNRDKWQKIYNRFDAGLVFGVQFFENEPVGFYIRNSYGLLPMVDYYDIDREGNFHGEIHDLRNMCISLGIQINFIHEDIVTYR